MFGEIAKVIYLISIGQGLLVAYLLLLKPSNNPVSNRLLVIFVGTMLLPLWQGYISLTPALGGYAIPYLFWFIPWVYGPLMWLYVCSVIDPQWRLQQQGWWHFSYLLLPILIILGEQWFRLVFGNPNVRLISWGFCFLQIFTYLGLSVNKVRFAAKKNGPESGLREQVEYIWLYKLVWGFLLVFFVDMSIFFLIQFKGYDAPWYFHTTVLTESLYVITLGLIVLRKPALHRDTLLVPQRPKYQHSALSNQVAEQLIDRINQQLHQQCYLNHEVSLTQLAEQLGVEPHHLSQVLNTQMGESFHELINRRRIDHAKKLLLLEASYSILQVAFESGFNNKASFNKAFKKYTGITPSEYRLKKAS